MNCGHCKSREVTLVHVRGCSSGSVITKLDRLARPLVRPTSPTSAPVIHQRSVPVGEHQYPTLDSHAGMYRNPLTEEIFKVQKAVHGSGHLYAKILIVHSEGSAEFEMASGMVRKIRLAWRMSIEEARKYGALYGVCVRCGRTLTDEYSIANGIGPICAGKI